MKRTASMTPMPAAGPHLASLARYQRAERAALTAYDSNQPGARDNNYLIAQARALTPLARRAPGPARALTPPRRARRRSRTALSRAPI